MLTFIPWFIYSYISNLSWYPNCIPTAPLFCYYGTPTNNRLDEGREVWYYTSGIHLRPVYSRLITPESFPLCGETDWNLVRRGRSPSTMPAGYFTCLALLSGCLSESHFLIVKAPIYLVIPIWNFCANPQEMQKLQNLVAVKPCSQRLPLGYK